MLIPNLSNLFISIFFLFSLLSRLLLLLLLLLLLRVLTNNNIKQTNARLERTERMQVEVMRGICANANTGVGKRIVFCETRKICDALQRKFQAAAPQGMGEPHTVCLHGGSHGGDLILRDADLTRFKTHADVSVPTNELTS